MKMKPTVVIASDHAGFRMKEFLKGQLIEAGYAVEDFGTRDESPADTAPYAIRVGEEVAAHPEEKMGILVCGTGLGMSIAANKVSGVRASLVHDLFSAHATREHNDANVLCMGARVISAHMGWEIAKVWLKTETFGPEVGGGKYRRRVEQIADYEKARS